MSEDADLDRIVELIGRVDAVLEDVTYGEMLQVASHLILTAIRALPQEERTRALSGFSGVLRECLAA